MVANKNAWAASNKASKNRGEPCARSHPTACARWLVWAYFLILSGLSGQAQAMLEATLDRTEITENESVELTISGDLKVSSSNNLFNLNTLSIPQPDVSALENDFEILDRQQSYRVQIINNRNESVITWKYTLMPRRKGDLVIPSIAYEGQKTEPITLRVRETVAKAGQDRDVFLEAEIDLTEVFVQQQLIYRVRLYYALDLISGDLEPPQHQDAVFTQIGKQKEYSRYVGPRRFSVIERNYAVFPEVAGEMVIPSINFSGTFIQRRMGRRVFRKDATDPITVQVKPPPASFTGKVWLPAQSLSIRDVWSDPAREIKVGDSLTRTVQMLALGLEGVQLPPLPRVDIGGLKVYPEPGKSFNDEHAAGITGNRHEVQALIATQPGTYSLPEIRIPWWDVENNRERVAILQGRVINVLPSALSNTGPPQTSASDSPQALAGANNLNQQLTPGQSASDSAASDSAIVWQSTTAALLLLWLATLYFWWRAKPRAAVPDVASPAGHAGSQPSLENLKQLAEQGSTNFIKELTLWLNQFRRHSNGSIHQAEALEAKIRPLLNGLQRSCYGPQQQQSLDKDDCLEIINILQSHAVTAEKKKDKPLAPFYPTTNL